MAYPVLIRGLEEALSNSREVSGEIDFPEIRLGEEVFTPLGPASFIVGLTNTGAGIVASGEVRAKFRTNCVRCLCDFEIEALGDVETFYVHPGDDSELPEEQEREYITDEKIDLEPALVQALVVELPFAPVHTEECKGLCPTCGANLNEGECECPTEEPESPFAALKSLLGEDKGDKGGER